MDRLSDSRDDSFDTLLDRSAAATPLSARVTDEVLQEAARAAQLESARDTRRRRTPRLLVAGVAVAAILGGTGVAAAANNYTWPSWAPEADANLTITLPSGTQCEYLIGGLADAEPEITDAARAFIASASPPTAEEVDEGVIAVWGETVAGSPASERNHRYSMGVVQVIGTELDEYLQEQGFDPAERPTFEGVITCPEGS